MPLPFLQVFRSNEVHIEINRSTILMSNEKASKQILLKDNGTNAILLQEFSIDEDMTTDTYINSSSILSLLPKSSIQEIYQQQILAIAPLILLK